MGLISFSEIIDFFSHGRNVYIKYIYIFNMQKKKHFNAKTYIYNNVVLLIVTYLPPSGIYLSLNYDYFLDYCIIYRNAISNASFVSISYTYREYLCRSVSEVIWIFTKIQSVCNIYHFAWDMCMNYYLGSIKLE